MMHLVWWVNDVRHKTSEQSHAGAYSSHPICCSKDDWHIKILLIGKRQKDLRSNSLCPPPILTREQGDKPADRSPRGLEEIPSQRQYSSVLAHGYISKLDIPATFLPHLLSQEETDGEGFHETLMFWGVESHSSPFTSDEFLQKLLGGWPSYPSCSHHAG